MLGACYHKALIAFLKATQNYGFCNSHIGLF